MDTKLKAQYVKLKSKKKGQKLKLEEAAKLQELEGVRQGEENPTAV